MAGTAAGRACRAVASEIACLKRVGVALSGRENICWGYVTLGWSVLIALWREKREKRGKLFIECLSNIGVLFEHSKCLKVVCLPQCVCVYVCVCRGPGPSHPSYSRSPAGASRFMDAFNICQRFFSFFLFAFALVLFLYLPSVPLCLCLCSCVTCASDPVSLIVVLMWASWKSSCRRGFATQKKRSWEPDVVQSRSGKHVRAQLFPPSPSRCSFPSHKLKRRTLCK